MAEPRREQPAAETADRLIGRLEGQEDIVVQQVLSSMGDEVPDMVGPSPMMCELATQMITANLRNVRAALRCRAGLASPHVPPANVEYARLLAQRGTAAHRVLLGYQVANRLITHNFIEHVAAVAVDRDDLLTTIATVLAYVSAYGDAATQTVMEAHYTALGLWRGNPGVAVAARLDTVLSGVVTDEKVAGDILRYPVSGSHVAAVVWMDDSPAQPLDLTGMRSHWQSLPGVRDTLAVQRDERTLVCWLNVADDVRIGDWMKIIGAQDSSPRIAFGELGKGIEGFRTSNAQARAAANVLALARNSVGRVVRYREVSAISFLAYQPIRARAWTERMLGDLAGADEQLDRLRHDLYVFFDEGENITAASRRLFMHRNTLKSRIDRAYQLLPKPAGEHRLDLALALAYCEWVSVWGMGYRAGDPPSREVAAYTPGDSRRP